MLLLATTRSSLPEQELVLALRLQALPLELQLLALPASALLPLSELPASSAQQLFSLLAWLLVLPLVLLQVSLLAWPPP